MYSSLAITQLSVKEHRVFQLIVRA